jgi:hypothetical protein
MQDASGLMVRSEVQRLHETIKQFNEQSENYSKRIIKLTWAILGLTFVMAVLAGIQIYLILNPPI